MDETTGLKLIEELKKDPEKFFEEEKPYPLLEEYYNGLSIDTLRPLFYFEDKRIRQAAVWIVTELGSKGTDLMKEALTQINDSDISISGPALQIVASYAHGEYFYAFTNVFSFLEHPNQKSRIFVMHIISCLPSPRIHEACIYFENNKEHKDSYRKGLSALLNIDVLASSEIIQMIGSGDAVIRKYGIIAANMLYEKYPQIINEAVDCEDEDVREFSKLIVTSRAEAESLDE